MNNCNQNEEPTVDNTSPCCDYLYSECLVINRRSDLIKGAKGMSGNEYLAALEGEIRKLRLELKYNRDIVQQLKDVIPEGIGVFE